MILSIEPPEVLAAISKELAIVIASAGVRRLKLLPAPIAKGTASHTNMGGFFWKSKTNCCKLLKIWRFSKHVLERIIGMGRRP